MLYKQKSEQKFGIGLLLGAVVGGVAAFFLSPKSGKENREMVSKKMKEFEVWLNEKEVKAKAEKIWGDVSKESIDVYKKVTADLSKDIAALREKAGKINFEKYKELLNESIDKAKENYKTTPEQLKKLSNYLKEEWKLFAMKGEEDSKKVVEKDAKQDDSKEEK
jgi:gas vesicle protein